MVATKTTIRVKKEVIKKLLKNTRYKTDMQLLNDVSHDTVKRWLKVNKPFLRLPENMKLIEKHTGLECSQIVEEA